MKMSQSFEGEEESVLLLLFFTARNLEDNKYSNHRTNF